MTTILLVFFHEKKKTDVKVHYEMIKKKIRKAVKSSNVRYLKRKLKPIISPAMKYDGFAVSRTKKYSPSMTKTFIKCSVFTAMEK